MATTKTGADAPKTAAEMREWFETNKSKLQLYDAAMDPLKQLRDITKTATRSINSLDKETIVGYLKNPATNEANLRNASWYLLSRSQIYQRIIDYYAKITDLSARIVIPNYNMVEDNDDNAILKSWEDTLNMLEPWNIENEFFKIIVTCLVQDVFYGVAYLDDGMFILPLPAEYCRIWGMRPSGDLVFAFNMRYFTSRQDYLEWWGEPFQTMWNQFQSTGDQWQIVPDEYSCAFKWNAYSWDTIIPPLSGIFGSLIDLLDISDVTAAATKQEVYKLIYVKLKTLSNANSANQWEIAPDIVLQYLNRAINDGAFNDYSTVTAIPTNDDLGVIDFSSTNKTAERNKVLDANKNVLNSSGGAQILNSSEISGATAYKYAIMADTEYALSLLDAIEGWFNRIAKIRLSNPSKIHFFRVGKYTKEDLRKQLLEDAQYSLPAKLSVMALDSGMNQKDLLSMNHLENDILKLGDKFNQPLASSYTSTGSDTGGAPTKDVSDLGDEGAETRDKN